MSNLTVDEWTTPTTPVHPDPVERAVSLATSVVEHILFPERDSEDDISDSGMANSAFGGSRSVLDESISGRYILTAEDSYKQELRTLKADLARREAALQADLAKSEAAFQAPKNTIQIQSEADIEPYVSEIATNLKTFVEKNNNRNKIFPNVLVGIVRLNGRLMFKRSRDFEVKEALTNLGVISNPTFDDSGNEFYTYNTRFVIPSGCTVPVSSAAVSGGTISGAAVSQLSTVVHPSSSKLPVSANTWKQPSSPNNLLDAFAGLDFDSLDFKTLKAIRSTLMKKTAEIDICYNKKRTEMQALLDEEA
jgi:hypothetical protein